MIRRSWARRVLWLTSLICVLIAAAVIPGATQIAPTWMLVGVGDSLTHGSMDATNNTLNTVNAYLHRMAIALIQRIPLLFFQPLLNENGGRVSPYLIPTNLAVDGEDSFSIDGLEYYKRAGTATSTPSSKYTADKLFPALFADLHDAVLFPINIYARKPVSQMQAAEWLLKQWPRDIPANALIVYWVGNNDSSAAALGFGGSNPMFLPLPVHQLGPVLPGITALLMFAEAQGIISSQPYTQAAIDRNLTLLTDFSAQQTSLMTRLVSASAGRARHIFVLTLPYYSSVGYLMDSEDLEFYLRKINPAYSVPPSFKRVAPEGQPITDPLQGDRISLLTFGLMYALLDTGFSPAYVNSVLEIEGQQRDGMVLSESEQLHIMAHIDGFNATLRSVASSAGPNVHLVDLGQHMNDILTGRNKLVIGTKEISRKWMRGSAFTFDGVHPGYTGHAFISNYLIEFINDVMGINAPVSPLAAVLDLDPYIDRDNDGFAAGPNYKASGMTELLFLFKDPDDSNANVQVELPSNVWELIARALLKEIIGKSTALDAEAARLGLVPSKQ